MYTQSCMTEDQKYQGALYKDKSKKNNNQNQSQNQPQNNTNTTAHKHDSNPQPAKKTKMMAHQSYVQDVPEDAAFSPWAEYQGQTEDERSPIDAMPEAPTPPPAVHEDLNVFQYLISTGQTPNTSNTDLAKELPADGESTTLVRYEHATDKYLVGDEPLVQYGSGPIPTDAYVTPGPKTERRRSRDGDKKDKKRKRLHVEVAGDEEMTDAPPVLHSGLTGGLKSLMRFPPSPDYSGDGADATPASPLKKSKHTKTAKNSILDMITGGSKKSKKSKDKKKSRRHREDRSKSPKMLEFSKDAVKGDNEGQMILFKPRADVFLGFVNKGPESDRGCSMNKALKRYHRERKTSGANVSKIKDEKELWRSLRLRRNDRGEIVVFALDEQ